MGDARSTAPTAAAASMAKFHQTVCIVVDVPINECDAFVQSATHASMARGSNAANYATPVLMAASPIPARSAMVAHMAV